MRFLIFLIALTLIAGVFMGGYGEMKHFRIHKKKCVCIKEIPGYCLKLRCCDVFQHVPYEVYVKFCKYGKCKFHKKHEKKYY